MKIGGKRYHVYWILFNIGVGLGPGLTLTHLVGRVFDKHFASFGSRSGKKRTSSGPTKSEISCVPMCCRPGPSGFGRGPDFSLSVDSIN